MKKLHNLFISLALALIAVFSCFAPMAFYGKTEKTLADDAPAPAEGKYTDLYFFTDHSMETEYEDEIVTGALLEQHFYNYTGWEPIDWIEEVYWAGDYEEISNAYVIIEIRTPIDGFDQTEDKTIFDFLYDIFYTLDGNGCYTMFICGTDESRFAHHNAFLNYVDIHINTDKFTTFFASMLYDVIEDTASSDYKINNCTFIFNADISVGIQGGYKNSWLFYNCFIPFIRSVYKEDIIENGLTNRNVLEANNIKIFCNVGSMDYFDAVTGTLLNDITDYDLANYLENEYIYAVSYSNNLMSNDEFVSTMCSLRADVGVEFPIYLYLDHILFMENITNLYTAQWFDSNAYNAISTILPTFLARNSLAGYDNWSGVCDVTHKVIDIDPNGWMRDVFGGMRYDLWDWPINFGEDLTPDSDFYYNYSDGWN